MKWIGGKAILAATATIGGLTFTLTPDEWRLFLSFWASLIIGLAGLCLKWHMKSQKKNDRLHGKGKKCEDDQD